MSGCKASEYPADESADAHGFAAWKTEGDIYQNVIRRIKKMQGHIEGREIGPTV